MGWKDTGYGGSDFYETPRIDRMAKDGMDFSQAYASAGNCAPSRACLLSGGYTPRHGVYAVGSTDRGPKKSQRLIPVPNKSGLSVEVVTLADALSAAGYVTGIFGKWHLSGKDGCEPAEQGSQTVMDRSGGNPNKSRGINEDPKGVFSITRNSLRFMAGSTAEKKPFFAYVSHHAIHSSLEAKPETLAKFKAKAKGKQHDHALYAACTCDFDASVGMLLDGIQELGIADNPLIIFTSDNHAVELYHLKTDPGEHTDLAATETAKRDELIVDLLAWVEESGAIIPTESNSGYVAGSGKKAGKKSGKKRK